MKRVEARYLTDAEAAKVVNRHVMELQYDLPPRERDVENSPIGRFYASRLPRRAMYKGKRRSTP